MNYDCNDPRLTAYALGELDDAEIAAIEAQIAACAESRKAVEEVRWAARLLEDELRLEAGPGLAPKHLQTIEGHLVAPGGGFFSANGLFKFALAASVVGGIGVATYMSLPSKNAKPVIEVAANTPKTPVEDGLTGAARPPVRTLATTDGPTTGWNAPSEGVPARKTVNDDRVSTTAADLAPQLLHYQRL